MSAKKKILLLATGGTIASKKSENGLKPQITPEELLEYIPQVKEFCEVSAIQLLNLDSSNMEPEHWKKIVHAIREYYDAYDGFVIAHGTDTMAYTAAALSYMIQNSTKPIVITGAQKPIDLEITDAKSNLIALTKAVVNMQFSPHESHRIYQLAPLLFYAKKSHSHFAPR